MPDLSHALEIALQHHAAGRLAETEAIYRQILAEQPDHAAALHLLGVVALQRGEGEKSIELIRRALDVQPDFATASFNLGNALVSVRRPEEAVTAYRRALELQPTLAEAHNNLGATLRVVGRRDEALAALRRGLECCPEHTEAWANLGLVLGELGHLDEAIAAYAEALRLRPGRAESIFGLGNVLRDRGRHDEAIAAYQRALALQPGYEPAITNLGTLLEMLGRYDEAIGVCRFGLQCHPHSVVLHNNLAHLLKILGEVEEALGAARRAVELAPHAPGIHSNLLVDLQYSSGVTLAGLLAAHCEFDQRHAASLRPVLVSPPPARDPARPLRIGMISPHFAFHPVGHFLVRLLENLDRREIETVGYSDTAAEDPMTVRLRAAMSEWRDVRPLADEALAQRIADDRIDILFDLAGHTAGNRLLVCARRPAPLQITWLDYVGTTGLAAMDYILADARQIPPGAEHGYRERVLRLPRHYICYDPPASAPPVGALPALAAGRVTFGSFNLPAKTTPEIVRVWARILAAIPGSRLILKNRGFDSPGAGARYGQLFAAAGIDPGRIALRGWSPPHDVLAAYGEIDLALDTWPYHGGLTTCEALWMGVPVVTCPGETFASRHGLAHLTAAGCPETIARDLDHYVELATGLARDLPALAARRATLRARVAASPLCDGPAFARDFTALLRKVWAERECDR